MKRVIFLTVSLISLTVMVLFTAGCKDDDYYKKPSWVGEPIYFQLEQRGDFTNYLTCVDKSGFADVLKKTGLYTVFAPDDAAFESFLQENNIQSIDSISREMASKIVSYSLVSVASRADEISNYQKKVSEEDKDKILNIAYKRATNYSKGVYKYVVPTGQEIDVIDINGASSNPDGGGVFYINDKNMKPIPYFTDAFLQTKGLTAADYNYFYKDVEFSGFNVVDAKVIEKDIRAENGIIHVVDKVILPLENLEEVLMNSEKNSDFKDIIERYTMLFYNAPRDFLLAHEKNTGVYKDIYIKDYSALHIPLNSENYLREDGVNTDNQIDGWTIFAPTNEALEQYFQDVFLAKGYQTLEQMPQFVINELINAHMFRTTVWPSKFASIQNYFGEPALFDKDIDVEKSVLASNGIFYSVDKVQETNSFITVLGEILLNPEYTMMYRALVATDNVFQLKSPIARQQIYLINNDQFEEMGITYSAANNEWEITNPNWTDLPYTTILNRLFDMHIILHSNSAADLHDMSTGFGIVKTNNENNTYIRYYNGRIWGPGQTISTASSIVAVNDTMKNGVTYELNKPFLFTTENIGHFIENNANYREFFRYINKSANSLDEDGEYSRMVYNPDDKTLTDINLSEVQTYLIPNNQAIDAAVQAGLLPAITAAHFTFEEQEMVSKFVKYHILRRQMVFPNGGYNDIAYTNYKDSDGDTHVSIDSNTENKLIIYDKQGRQATATATGTAAHTNVLANRAILHLIDNYLDYRNLEEDNDDDNGDD